MQNRLAFILHFVVSATMMGMLVTAALAMGRDDGRSILLAALAGFVLAVPTSWLIARKITHIVKS